MTTATFTPANLQVLVPVTTPAGVINHYTYYHPGQLSELLNPVFWSGLAAVPGVAAGGFIIVTAAGSNQGAFFYIRGVAPASVQYVISSANIG